MRTPDRRTTQLALRVAALLFVACWLFARSLQELVPFWIPFVILLAAELELGVRAWREPRGGLPRAGTEEVRERRLPGSDDADLGWGQVVEDDEGELVWIPPPERPRRKGRRLVTIGIAALLVLVFVLAARTDHARTWAALDQESRARAEARFGAEAARIAGRKVTIRCDADYLFTGIGSDALGVAFIRRRLAYLDPFVCRELHDLVFRHQGEQRDDTAEAVLVLAHESVHLAGERDEGVTECKALQEGVKLGARLGLGENRARAAMRALYLRNLGEHSITRHSYRLPDGCSDGGSLDLRPSDDRFP